MFGFGTDGISITSPQVDSGNSYVGQSYTINITDSDYQYSDLYAKYYSKVYTAGLKDVLALGGDVVGLQASDFGYHRQEILNSGVWLASGFDSIFYIYDDNRLATRIRSDEAVFSGNLLGTIGNEAIVDGHLYGTRKQILDGTITTTIDFATKNLSLLLDTRLDNKEYGFGTKNGTVNKGKSIIAGIGEPEKWL